MMMNQRMIQMMMIQKMIQVIYEIYFAIDFGFFFCIQMILKFLKLQVKQKFSDVGHDSHQTSYFVRKKWDIL